MFLCFFFHQFFSQIYISGEAQIFGEENITTVPKSDEESKISTRKLHHKERSGIAVTKKSSDTKVKKIIEDAKKTSHVNNFKYRKLPDPDTSFGISKNHIFSSVPASVFKLKYLQAFWIFDTHAFSYNFWERSERFIIEIFHEADKRVFSVRPPPFIS
ncbi:hypothetical protein [Chryseobacterium taihuense]|uniref:Uncharacterized protein n=1 Tax=Chryseobacterium taihuense TaxID=1141221 RepID=A0ABY0QWL5_9FLAO|nr:hypothetical protein [Chryseobacterium taihuense]SDM03017.1 hypothetical protein SAMN05216273_11131 [Chryseobacterium taihuense]